jgi:hypothetical protein
MSKPDDERQKHLFRPALGQAMNPPLFGKLRPLAGASSVGQKRKMIDAMAAALVARPNATRPEPGAARRPDQPCVPAPTAAAPLQQPPAAPPPYAP